MKNKFLSVVISILLVFTLTSCSDKTMNQVKTLVETIEYLEKTLKEVTIKFEQTIEQYKVHIEKLKIGYEKKLKSSSKKYHELMAERDLLEKTIKELKEENHKLKNRGTRVNREMF